MQDLSTYQSDPADTDPGTAAPAQQRTKTMMRSKSESYNRGEMTPRPREDDEQWCFGVSIDGHVCINGFLFKSIGLRVL